VVDFRVFEVAGKKGRSGRPGGNPDIVKYSFKPSGEEGLSIRLQIKITKSMATALEALGDRKSDFVRQAITDALASDVSEE
jgi:hypothetical protein